MRTPREISLLAAILCGAVVLILSLGLLPTGANAAEEVVLYSGRHYGQETAFGLINHGATLCVVGFTMEKIEVRLSNLMAYHARALGNWGCPPELYPAALDLVLGGQVKIAPFIEKHPLDEINRVFEAVHHGALKRRAVLVPTH
ncbi:MAG: bamQ [Candidatus Rokubacteria bacterium]|nr:bamQ [Candidatus Rokubacteria bacterium]